MKWTIYCHTHIESGRRYVGLTAQTLEKRWKNHICASKSAKGGRWHFPNAIRKYGPEAFSHEVLEICEDLDVANLAEECWIELLDTRNPEKGFNLAKGGVHVPHRIRKNPWDNPAFRARNISDMSKCHTPESRAKSKAALNSPEVKAKISAAARAAAARPGSKEKRIAASKEVTSRPEVLAKMSLAARRRQTHCKRGHPLHDARIRKNGQRACRVCTVQRTKEWRRRKSAGPVRVPGVT